MSYCTSISDAALKCLSKCARLNTLEIRGCPLVSSVGVSTIASGCRQLSKLDIKKCCDINDAAMLSLAHFSHNLRQVGLYSMDSIFRIELLILCSKCTSQKKINSSIFLLQINLSYCSVTDVGVLALASISCLQVVTMLHLSGMSPNGLSMALLMCGSLMKVKLHMSFKPFISSVLIERVELRGCTFLWLNKSFQVCISKFFQWLTGIYLFISLQNI
jgi:F-box and leucine-rich repeat protein 2/20